MQRKIQSHSKRLFTLAILWLLILNVEQLCILQNPELVRIWFTAYEKKNDTNSIYQIAPIMDKDFASKSQRLRVIQ